MKFKNLSLRTLLEVFIFSLIYPGYRYFKADNFKMVAFCDAITITSLILLILGLWIHVVGLGGFNAIRYTAKRNFFRYDKSFSEYERELNKQKENSFNYPLCLAIILFLLSLLISLFL